MYLTICIPCCMGDCRNCQVGEPPPDGMYGGWQCACPQCKSGPMSLDGVHWTESDEDPGERDAQPGV